VGRATSSARWLMLLAPQGWRIHRKSASQPLGSHMSRAGSEKSGKLREAWLGKNLDGHPLLRADAEAEPPATHSQAGAWERESEFGDVFGNGHSPKGRVPKVAVGANPRKGSVNPDPGRVYQSRNEDSGGRPLQGRKRGLNQPSSTGSARGYCRATPAGLRYRPGYVTVFMPTST
jgi:hypothetical protein